METLSNVASTAATTVSNLIYGQPEKNNETAGQEPISGEQGKGTVNEPFDKGNTESAGLTSSTTNPTTTDGTSEDFLKLNPTMGKPSTTESSAHTTTGSTAEPTMPVIPLVPDSAAVGTTGTTTSTTGTTSTSGVTDKVWKPTALDEVTTAGAPGAGPSAPSTISPAVPEGYDGSSKKTAEPVGSTVGPTTESKTDSAIDSKTDSAVEHKTETPRDSATTETNSGPTGTSGEHKGSVAPDVDAILHKTPKAEHSVPDEEVNDPHSKMQGKTVRKTDAAQPDTTGEAPVIKGSAHKTESNTSGDSKSHEHASGEEKDSKISGLKEKLKTKLHIGSKDK